MLTVTEAATKKLSELLSQQEGVLGLRLSAIPGGCSGYQYGMAFAEQTVEGDWVGEFDGVKVYVDADSATVLNGVKVDYVETLHLFDKGQYDKNTPGNQDVSEVAQIDLLPQALVWLTRTAIKARTASP